VCAACGRKGLSSSAARFQVGGAPGRMLKSAEAYPHGSNSLLRSMAPEQHSVRFAKTSA
jgi:hypothetical protein